MCDPVRHWDTRKCGLGPLRKHLFFYQKPIEEFCLTARYDMALGAGESHLLHFRTTKPSHHRLPCRLLEQALSEAHTISWFYSGWTNKPHLLLNLAWVRFSVSWYQKHPNWYNEGIVLPLPQKQRQIHIVYQEEMCLLCRNPQIWGCMHEEAWRSSSCWWGRRGRQKRCSASKLRAARSEEGSDAAFLKHITVFIQPAAKYFCGWRVLAEPKTTCRPLVRRQTTSWSVWSRLHLSWMEKDFKKAI